MSKMPMPSSFLQWSTSVKRKLRERRSRKPTPTSTSIKRASGKDIDAARLFHVAFDHLVDVTRPDGGFQESDLSTDGRVGLIIGIFLLAIGCRRIMSLIMPVFGLMLLL